MADTKTSTQKQSVISLSEFENFVGFLQAMFPKQDYSKGSPYRAKAKMAFDFFIEKKWSQEEYRTTIKLFAMKFPLHDWTIRDLFHYYNLNFNKMEAQ